MNTTGVAAGVFGSLVGMGGAFVMIPAMTGVLKFSQHQAHGPSSKFVRFIHLYMKSIKIEAYTKAARVLSRVSTYACMLTTTRFHARPTRRHEPGGGGGDGERRGHFLRDGRGGRGLGGKGLAHWVGLVLSVGVVGVCGSGVHVSSISFTCTYTHTCTSITGGGVRGGVRDADGAVGGVLHLAPLGGDAPAALRAFLYITLCCLIVAWWSCGDDRTNDRSVLT